MPSPFNRPPSLIVSAVALAGIVLSAAAVGIIGFDVWWDLTTGWIIANLKMIPHYDLFSYTAFGRPWVNHQWLYQLIQWLAYEHFGVGGMLALKTLILAGISAILFRSITYLSSSRNMALWGVILFIWGVANKELDRPMMVVLLLLAAFILILHKYIREGGWAVWTLPVLQVIWINSHGGGLLGVMAIFAFAAGESLQPFCRERLGGPEPIEKARRHRLWLTGLLCLTASLINPWGADIFLYYGELRKMTLTLQYTQEWLTPLHPLIKYSIPQYIYLAIAAAAFASHVLNASRVRLSHLFLSAGTVMLLCKGHRFGSEMMIANLPLICLNLTERFPSLAGTTAGRSWISAIAALVVSALALTFGIPMKFDRKPENMMGIYAPGYSAPARLVSFLEYHGIKGRVFNDMGLGAYLIFRRWPGEPVFIDGRTPIYGDDFFIRFSDAFVQSKNFEDLKKEYQFDYIVLANYNSKDIRQVHDYLFHNPEWRLVYAMDDGYVYLRNVPKFRKLIEKLALKRHPLLEELEKMEREERSDE